MVGARRFELRTSASQTQRSARLSYAPGLIEPARSDATRHGDWSSTDLPKELGSRRHYSMRRTTGLPLVASVLAETPRPAPDNSTVCPITLPSRLWFA